MGWRVFVISLALIISVIASEVIYWPLGYGHDPRTFFGAIFAAWLGGLALFVVIGLVVAVVTLVRPEQESFDARARILFRQSGKHVDYIIRRIATVLEHYNESASIKVTITSHNPVADKCRICCEATTIVKAYIDDITSTVSSRIKLKRITAAPPGGDPNRIMFLRLDGISQPGFTADFTRAIDLPYTITIEPHQSCEVSRGCETWTKTKTENNTHTPVRYTQKTTLAFENRLQNAASVRVHLSKDRGTSWEQYDLGPGESKELFQCSDAEANEEIYRYRVTPL
jgi:hypothetical protein